MKRFIIAMICIARAATALAQDKPQVYVHAHLIPIAGPEIDNGVLVVQAGKIVAAGKADDVKPPNAAS